MDEDCNHEYFHSLVEKTRTAFDTGRSLSISWRKQQLKNLARFLDVHKQEFYEALKKDLNKCKMEVDVFEMSFTHTEITNAYNNLESWSKPEKYSTGLAHKLSSYLVRPQPYGVCLIIGTWNYPIAMVCHPLVGAIAAGNCAVVKPSEVAPNTAKIFEKYLNNYIDKECFPVVVTGPKGSASLVNENRFDMIMYTGSANVGKLIMKAASKYLTPVLLELGGKNPCIVDKSCDVKLAARRIAWAAYVNCGQICLTPDHVLCDKEIKNDLIKYIKKNAIEFFGENPQTNSDYGRVINNRHWHRLVNMLNKTKIVFGGQTDEEDRYIAPTILDNVTEDDLIMQEEVFGPILPIIPVDNVDEAIAFTRRRHGKPLALYIFAKDRTVIDKVLTKTTSGGAAINDCMMQFNEYLPFGGVGESGIGSYHGKHSFDAFSHKRSVYDDGLPDAILGMRYPPYNETKRKNAVRFAEKRISEKSSLLVHFIKLTIIGIVLAYLYKARATIKQYLDMLRTMTQATKFFLLGPCRKIPKIFNFNFYSLTLIINIFNLIGFYQFK